MNFSPEEIGKLKKVAQDQSMEKLPLTEVLAGVFKKMEKPKGRKHGRKAGDNIETPSEPSRESEFE